MEHDISILLIVRHERNNCSEPISVKTLASLASSPDLLVTGMGKVKTDSSFLLFMVCTRFPQAFLTLVNIFIANDIYRLF